MKSIEAHNNNAFKNIPKNSIIFFESKIYADLRVAAWKLGRVMQDYQQKVENKP